MKNKPPMDFERAFYKLTGNPSFPWRRKLYERLVESSTCFTMVAATRLLGDNGACLVRLIDE